MLSKNKAEGRGRRRLAKGGGRRWLAEGGGRSYKGRKKIFFQRLTLNHNKSFFFAKDVIKDLGDESQKTKTYSSEGGLNFFFGDSPSNGKCLFK